MEGDSAGYHQSRAETDVSSHSSAERKILNVENDEHRFRAEIRNIYAALGVTSSTEEFKALNLFKLRYPKVVIMTDADVDGT